LKSQIKTDPSGVNNNTRWKPTCFVTNRYPSGKKKRQSCVAYKYDKNDADCSFFTKLRLAYIFNTIISLSIIFNVQFISLVSGPRPIAIPRRLVTSDLLIARILTSDNERTIKKMTIPVTSKTQLGNLNIETKMNVEVAAIADDNKILAEEAQSTVRP
jgi:hypothetical protein